MKFKIKYPFLLATLAILALVITGLFFNALTFGLAIAYVIAFQLVVLSFSRPQAALLVAGLSPEQVKEFEGLCEELKDFFPTVKGLPDKVAKLFKDNDELRGELRKLRKSGIGLETGVRWIGNKPFVTSECAESLTATFVIDCARLKNGLESLVPEESARQRLIAKSAGILGLETRTALTNTEVPLPTAYVGQVVELVFKYGQARQFATVFPLGTGTVKLPRLKAGEDDFGYLGAGTAGISQPVGEKRVTAELVTFTANKAGGLIRLPYELNEDTFIPIGQFLARYIARQLAKLEDKTMFIADGTATYASQTGVGPYCVANPTYLLQLAAGKTKWSDVTLDDLRAIRGKVSAAVLGDMAANGQTEAAYYFHPSAEPMLRSFNKYPNFVVFTNENGKPMFDGWPIRWIGVGATNDGSAQPSAFAAFFGALSYWYLGERGAVRVEVSKEVFFASDELALRALERIDVEAMATDAMAALQLGAAA